MDFELSDDQVALAEGIAALCEGRFDIASVRALMDVGGVDRDRWRELADTGVFSLTLPEADGGLGLGWADAAVVFEQLGRFLVPGPLTAQLLAAGLVDGAATGEAVVGVVERPEGKPAMVEHLSVLDVLCVLDGDGVWRVDPSSLSGHTPVPLDALTPVTRVEQLPRGEQLVGPEEADRWRRCGAVLTAALQLGLAAGATDLAVAYAKERKQFDKPIGSFQAIKHICADMASRVEVMRAAVYWAACAQDDPEVADPAYAASVAKVVSAHAEACGRDCVQVHGGMGFTWEVDAHLYLKRMWVLDHAFGAEHEHADAVAAALG